jgi:hypothetical protein
MLDRPHTQLLGQTEGVALVAFGATTVGHVGHHQLLRVWRQDLPESRALRPLLDAHVTLPGDHAQALDQRLAVGLDQMLADSLPLASTTATVQLLA